METCRLKIYFSLLIILLFATSAPAQLKIINGVVKDSHSDERIPFASVQFQKSTIGKLTDSAGTFRFHFSSWPSDTLLITCVGYQPYKLFLPTTLDTITIDIIMERGTFNEGAKVKAKVNKGLYLWRKIVGCRS